MKEYSVRKYEPADYALWNQFVANAKNATFLFHRDFMEYHSDRFEDYSLLVFNNKKKLSAIIPANVFHDHIFSHQGLTYGGLVYNEGLKLASVIDIFRQILCFLNKNGVKNFQIKCIPAIYHQKPAEELLYVLFLTEAILIRRDALAVIDLNNPIAISKGRLEGVQKGKRNQLKIIEESVFDGFWNEVLIPNLAQKHHAMPVHSLEEIKYLQSKFPKNIRQFNVYFEGKIVAGTTIFESEKVAHAQYISANEFKNELGSLDFLYHHLITSVFDNKKYFDFGISNESQGRKLNNGLSFWKESFGSSCIVQDFYDIATAKFNLLDNIVL